MQNTNTIEKLLKDELSATETYQRALDELNFPGGQYMTNSIRPMLGDHKEAVSMLEEHILKLGGTPPKIAAGTWGKWPALVLEHSELSGKKTALKVLIESEKTGESYYIESLKDSTLPADFRTLVQSKLLPNQQIHIRSLDRVLETIDD
jgi:hypothetical protein